MILYIGDLFIKSLTIFEHSGVTLICVYTDEYDAIFALEPNNTCSLPYLSYADVAKFVTFNNAVRIYFLQLK